MLKFLAQRLLGDSLRGAILNGIRVSVKQKLKLDEPLDQEQIAMNIAEQIALESEKGISAGKTLFGEFNKVKRGRNSKFKP